jgi:hypothetical protein
MFARKIIPFLALSALIALPAGIASAEIRVQTDNANVVVGGGNGVQIYSNPSRSRIIRTPAQIYGPNGRSGKTPERDSSMQCNKRSITHRSVQRDSSRTSVNRTYSSQTSVSCQ